MVPRDMAKGVPRLIRARSAETVRLALEVEVVDYIVHKRVVNPAMMNWGKLKLKRGQKENLQEVIAKQWKSRWSFRDKSRV